MASLHSLLLHPLAIYWAWLETEIPMGMELVLLCTHVPIMSWIRNASQQLLATAMTLLQWKWYLQKRAKPDVVGFSELQEDEASILLQPLPIGLKELPKCLATWSSPWQCHHLVEGQCTILPAAVPGLPSQGKLSLLSLWWYKRLCTPLSMTSLLSIFL